MLTVLVNEAPDGFIENAIQGAAKIKEKIIFAFALI